MAGSLPRGRFRVYDGLQRTATTGLLGVTVLSFGEKATPTTPCLSASSSDPCRCRHPSLNPRCPAHRPQASCCSSAGTWWADCGTAGAWPSPFRRPEPAGRGRAAGEATPGSSGPARWAAGGRKPVEGLKGVTCSSGRVRVCQSLSSPPRMSPESHPSSGECQLDAGSGGGQSAGGGVRVGGGRCRPVRRASRAARRRARKPRGGSAEPDGPPASVGATLATPDPELAEAAPPGLASPASASRPRAREPLSSTPGSATLHRHRPPGSPRPGPAPSTGGSGGPDPRPPTDAHRRASARISRRSASSAAPSLRRTRGAGRAERVVVKRFGETGRRERSNAAVGARALVALATVRSPPRPSPRGRATLDRAGGAGAGRRHHQRPSHPRPWSPPPPPRPAEGERPTSRTSPIRPRA